MSAVQITRRELSTEPSGTWDPTSAPTSLPGTASELGESLYRGPFRSSVPRMARTVEMDTVSTILVAPESRLSFRGVLVVEPDTPVGAENYVGWHYWNELSLRTLLKLELGWLSQEFEPQRKWPDLPIRWLDNTRISSMHSSVERLLDAVDSYRQLQPSELVRPDPIDSPILDQLTRLGGRLQLSRDELAELLGVSRRTVFNWLSGSVSPNPEARQRIQRILELLSEASSWTSSDLQWWLMDGDPSPFHLLAAQRWNEFSDRVVRASERPPARRSTQVRRLSPQSPRSNEGPTEEFESSPTNASALFGELLRLQRPPGASLGSSSTWVDPEIDTRNQTTEGES